MAQQPGFMGNQSKSTWKRGPLPFNTWGWGGVVTIINGVSSLPGFFFADFRGDHVILPHNEPNKGDGRRVELSQVLWYDNSLTLPPDEKETP